MAEDGRWSDLATRMGSGAVMVAVGLAAVAAGGHVFHAFIALVSGAMVWELARMLAPERPALAVQMGLLSCVALFLAIYLPGILVLPVLLAPALAGATQMTRYRMIHGGFVALVMLAGYEMMAVRDDFGFVWMLWLVLVVVASDVGGYFAGRMIGGPKFWPRVSPKKTWSGTVAGWIGAAVVGLVFMLTQQTGAGLVLFSMVVALAAQMGDIAESAIKRMVGVKDASALIPGHGGLLDRFDGMLGASVLVLLTGGLVGFPPVAG